MKTPLACRVLYFSLLVFLPTTALNAQAPTKIFVASFGNDANDGSRGAPKRNFQAAHNAVATGGQIVVLDTAGYGTLTITKSIAITVPPGVNGFITVAGGGTGVLINVNSGGSDDNVSLRGLIVEGGPNASGNGIYIQTCTTVTLDECVVRNFGYGIACANSGANQRLFVRGGSIRNCIGGIFLQPSGLNLDVVVRDCDIENNSNSGVLAGDQQGGSLSLLLADCTIANSGVVGVFTFGAGTLVRVEGCRIYRNVAGVSVNGGSQILSRGNNTLENNTTDNTFPATYSAK